MLDILIKNGVIVDGQTVTRGSLGVAGARIAARFGEGMELPSARMVIDAGDLLVLPGIVDPHVHFYGEGMGEYAKLAASGGVTTYIGMIRGEPDENLVGMTDRHCAEGERDSLTDFSFHVVLYDREDTIGALAKIAARGFRSYKMFLAYKRRGMMVSEAFLFSAMAEIRRLGGVALVHSEDGELIDRLEQAARAAGKTRPEHYAPTRPAEAEASAIDIVAMAAQATGCSAYIVHVSSNEGLAAVDRARRRGVPLWAETCPQYLFLSDDDLIRLGPPARIAPPLRTPADQRALGAALAMGVINTLGSDHASYSLAAKAKGREDIFEAPFGMPGAPTHFPVMFTWAEDAGVPLTMVVRAMSITPARVFGLDHCKGSLTPGLDADIVLVDPARRQQVDPGQLWPNLSPSPLAGVSLRGWPQTTISRGEIIWRDGRFLSEGGRGKLIAQAPRAIP